MKIQNSDCSWKPYMRIKILPRLSLLLHTNSKLNMERGVQVCFVHVCFVQVTILKPVWSSQHADAPRCAHFPTDICSVIQEGDITVEKGTHRGASVRQECHTLSLGRNKHGHNNSAPYRQIFFHDLR